MSASRSSRWRRRRSRRRARRRSSRRSNTRTCRRSSRVEDALAADADLRCPPHEMRLGDADAALAARAASPQGHAASSAGRTISISKARSPTRSPARPATCSSIPRPSIRAEVQHTVAKVLGLPDNAVTVEVRRMGGGFGGKESQPALIAAIAALVAAKTGRPAKLRLDRDDDMVMTGKRHDFRIDYDVGFDDERRDPRRALRSCGALRLFRRPFRRPSPTAPCSTPTMPMRCTTRIIRSRRMKTHTVSNTAFRGFGGPQGMVGIERVIDEIAFALGRDPLDVRRANFYPAEGGGITPYHMEVTDCVIAEMVDELEAVVRLSRAARGGPRVQRARTRS